MAYVKSKLTVIDKEMLLRAIMDRQSKEAEHITQGGIEFNKVPKLQLAFKNILKIGNLWEFTLLTKLELNNNSITKIEGLEHLKNLTWINLSFNNIEKMEGLESLRKLEFLNLLENRISVIENIDTLEELNLFSIANNCLGRLDDVIYLRKFKKLRTLNLYGNPLCEEDNYKLFIAAHFPDLQYLDYDLLDETTKNQANAEFWYVIEEMRDNVLQVQNAVEAKLRQETELQLYKDAFVEFLNGSHLFKSMFTDDPLKDKLHRLQGVDHHLRTYKHQMVELCKQLFAKGLSEQKRREAEVNSFNSQKKGIADNQQKASQMVADFERHRTQMLEDFQGLSDADISQCSADIDELCDSLMKLEFQLVTQLEDNIKTFDRDISSMLETFSITFRKTLEQCRELEHNHHEKMQEIARATLQKVAKGNVGDMPDDMRLLFEDKDLVMDALATAHNNHLHKINDRETQFVKRANAWKADLMAGIPDKEMKRNHDRVSEIHRYVDHLRDELEGLQ